MTELSLAIRVVQADTVLKVDLDDETLFLNTRTEQYIGLNETATRMFEVVTESESIAHAKQRLVEEFGVSPDVLERELFELVASLLAQGLIEMKASP